MTIGGRVKVLVGLGNLDAKIDQITAKINTSDISAILINLGKVKTKGRLETSMKGLEFGYSSDGGYIDDIDFDSPGVSGYGFGIDLGQVIIFLVVLMYQLPFSTWDSLAGQNHPPRYGDFHD